MTSADLSAVRGRILSSGDVAAAVQLACLLEVSAPKPGNVSPGRHFVDLRYEDFLVSAVAIGEPLAGAGSRPLGATVRLAIQATSRWTRTNTNLGIVLLLAPLARAALWGQTHDSDRNSDLRLGLPRFSNDSDPHLDPDFDPVSRDAVRRVLGATTIDDARDVYAAIRQASPGGLGQIESQDVAGEPTVSLLEAMRLAADRDGIAREYATAFEVTFGSAVPALEHARHDGLPWDDAVVETFLTLLAATPDTHVARRGGHAAARAVSESAQRVCASGGVRSAAGRRAIDEMDRALRDADNIGNPGTTADLTAAAIFVVLLRGGLSVPSGRGGDHAASR